jgi:DNA-binding NtrC family response regulator
LARDFTLRYRPRQGVLKHAEQSYRKLVVDCFWNCLARPIDTACLGTVLGHAMTTARPAAESLRAGLPVPETCGMVGKSPAIEDLRRAVEKVAQVDAPVLVIGESGTGKELVARAIHVGSGRRDKPFEAVNCAALPPTLIHAELFGHEKGAYTGAVQRRIGHFECANTGTLFLDEIGDIPEPLQTTLLRFLEQNVIRRVGGTRDLPLDVRIISATHVNLSKAMREGRFREDLFFRLEVLQLRVPALRERGDDIMLLAKHFLREFAAETGTKAEGFTGEAERVIAAYRWPGNVRELRNRVYRAVVMRDQGLICPQDMGFERKQTKVGPVVRLEEARAQAERNAISEALRRFDGDTTAAANALGVSRATLYRIMNKLGMAQKAG